MDIQTDRQMDRQATMKLLLCVSLTQAIEKIIIEPFTRPLLTKPKKPKNPNTVIPPVHVPTE